MRHLLIAVEMFDGVLGKRTELHARAVRTAMQHVLAAYACDGPASIAMEVEELLGPHMYQRDWETHVLQNIHRELQSLPPPGYAA